MIFLILTLGKQNLFVNKLDFVSIIYLNQLLKDHGKEQKFQVLILLLFLVLAVIAGHFIFTIVLAFFNKTCNFVTKL
jgi:hypothetical protein